MVFDFTASSSFELTATAGVPIWIVEGDDGSGWTKVSDGKKSGLVPSSYIQAKTPNSAKAPTIEGKRGTLPALRVRWYRPLKPGRGGASAGPLCV